MVRPCLTLSAVLSLATASLLPQWATQSSCRWDPFRRSAKSLSSAVEAPYFPSADLLVSVVQAARLFRLPSSRSVYPILLRIPAPTAAAARAAFAHVHSWPRGTRAHLFWFPVRT